MSPSSRRAWIEIEKQLTEYIRSIVALLAEGVDRNVKRIIATPERTIVALLAEGVDRNFIGKLAENKDPMSPSSRRAWIEICSGYAPRA